MNAKDHKKHSPKRISGYPKLRELILYISKVSKKDERFGSTKLNKILFYADFLGFLKFGKSISEDYYQRLKNGPAPKHLKPVKDKMLDKQELAEQYVEYFGRNQCRTVALRDPDLSLFSGEEIALVDEVIRDLWPLTGTDVSNASHQFIGWEVTKEGEKIPFELALIDRRELTQQELEYGSMLEAEAKKIRNAA